MAIRLAWRGKAITALRPSILGVILLTVVGLTTGCSKVSAPPSVEVVLESEPRTLGIRGEWNYYLKVEPDWEVVTEGLSDQLMVDVSYADGTKRVSGAPPGRKLVWKFQKSGIVQLRLRAPLKAATIDGLILKRPPTPTPTPQFAQVAQEGRPNVILYMIDTLRRDRLSCYGNPRPLTPNLDNLTKEAVVYDNLIASTSWTKPAVVSIFTGLSTRRHGVHDKKHRLTDKYPTIAETLTARGYRTASFAANPHMAEGFGLQRGFESSEVHVLESSDRLQERMFAWLAKDPSKPFFAYLHSVDPHDPYLPSPEFRKRFAPTVEVDRYFKAAPPGKAGQRLELLVDIMKGDLEPEMAPDLRHLYDAEVAFNDYTLGRLVDQLKQLNLYDSTLLIVVSDHGEEFLEHGGWRHGKTLYQEQLEVPLLVKYPKGAGAGLRVQEPVTHMDLFPTILNPSGESPPSDGRDLRLDGPDRAQESYLTLGPEREFESLVLDGWKLIRDTRGEQKELRLFDLSQDESRDLTDSNLVRFRYYLQILDALPKATSDESWDISPEVEEQLRALNYI